MDWFVIGPEMLGVLFAVALLAGLSIPSPAAVGC